MSISNRYSLRRKDKKLAGVCAELGQRFHIDPTFLRIGFVAVALLIEWEIALIAYVAAGIYFHVQKRRALSTDRPSDFERMDRAGKGRASLHDVRTGLEENDRRMMAIDHHLNSQNDELAREIEALRQEK